MAATASPVELSYRQWIEGNADLVNALPRGEFLREDLPQELQREVNSLRTNDVLERVGSVRRETQTDRRASTHTLAVFEVRDDAATIAEAAVNSREAICPCGHSGVRNRGDHFECNTDFCQRQFDRDELEVDA